MTDKITENMEESRLYVPTVDDFKIVGPDTAQSEVIYKPSLTFWQDGWRRFKKINLH